MALDGTVDEQLLRELMSIFEADRSVDLYAPMSIWQILFFVCALWRGKFIE